MLYCQNCRVPIRSNICPYCGGSAVVMGTTQTTQQTQPTQYQQAQPTQYQQTQPVQYQQTQPTQYQQAQPAQYQQTQPIQYQQAPQMQYIRPGGPPQGKSNTPMIIAVIVIVAIVIFAAMFALIILPNGSDENGGGPSNNSTAPNISMYWIESDNNPGNYTGNVIRISGGDPPRLSDVTIVYTQGRDTGSGQLSEIETSDLVVGDATLSFSDNDGNGRLGGEDTFSLWGAHDGDIIRLTYRPTSGEMYSRTF